MATDDQDKSKPKRRHVKKADANISLALKRYHASRTPEQKAAWRERVSIGTSVGMDIWHAQRTVEEREQSRERITDAAVCRMWTAHKPVVKFMKGHLPMGHTPEAIALRTSAQVLKASIKKIMADIVGHRPELIEDALVEGLLAPPPRSFPYLALAAAYLDGKPINAPPPSDNGEDLSQLTREQLHQRALALVEHLRSDAARQDDNRLPVIEIVPEESK